MEKAAMEATFSRVDLVGHVMAERLMNTRISGWDKAVLAKEVGH